MKNNGLFSTLFIEEIGKDTGLDDLARGRMATLVHAWKTREHGNLETLWETFMKQALGYLQFVPGVTSISPGVYTLFEDFSYTNRIAILCLIDTAEDIDEKTVGKFWPAKLLAHLRKHKLNWGILTNGATWRLYFTKSSRPFEDFVEIPLAEALEKGDEREYALFERFFHKDSFVPEKETGETKELKKDEEAGVYKCRLDRDKEASEEILDKYVKRPLLYQVDEVLQYLCNGFIADTAKKGEEYTEAERKEIFESAVKLLYRCLFFFYAEGRRLLPSEREKVATYEKHSIRALCREAHKFHWGKRKDNDGYDLWQHLKGLVNAVNDGDPEYGIMGYNGGLFDDEEEKFLGGHKLRNDFLSRALYLLAYVEPQNGNPDEEREIPYADLEVRHLGELYENILEYNVVIADAPFNRWMTKKGPVLRLESDGKPSNNARLLKKIQKGDVFFAQTALERKQTGSYYTPEPLVRFLNERAIIDPLREKFESGYRSRFDEFLDQANSGYDDSGRRGAARSAVALIERFVSEELLHFKVCDPAMGSGHFLVDASNQMSGLVVELLAEIPSMNGVQANATSNPNNWRRLITRHCLYGVDLNPLAVNLARLSLWLNSFAADHRLTFIDHHLRRGNSLIGIRTLDQLRDIPQRKKESKKKEKSQLKFSFNDIAKSLAEAAKAVKSIIEIPEDDTDRQKAMYDEASEKTQATLAPLSNLFTAYLMDGTIAGEEYRDLFLHLAKGKDISDINNTNLREAWSCVERYTARHEFFHWALAFPDVFSQDGKDGFDATVGNPPWDVLQPSTQEFYLQFDPQFRRYTKQEALKKINEIHDKHPEIAVKWNSYENIFKEASTYFKEPVAYSSLTKGKIDIYKAFLERFFQSLRRGGRMGIVVPSGLYTDQGCLPLRRLFFENSQIRCLYGFENRWPAVFTAVDGRFKFVAFSTQKGGKTESFKCSFMQHDPERLPSIDAKGLEILVKDVKRFSPESLDVMEVESQNELKITTKIYNGHPHLSDQLEFSWNVSLTQDFNLTSDSHLFNRKGEGLRLYEGKAFFQFDHQFSDITLWISEKYVKEKFLNKKWKKLIERGKKPKKTDYEFYRAAFRRIAASTNERTLLSTVLPKETVCPHTTFSIQRIVPGKNGTEQYLIDSAQTAWLVAALNSFILDFVIRHKISTGLDMHFVYTLPVPRKGNGDSDDDIFFWPIVSRVLRLVCTTEEYSQYWAEVFVKDWQNSDFWYPKFVSIDNYGPAHEREIRRRLRDETPKLTPEWKPYCGVYDRTPDRRDTGDRAQLRAEIDAYVAHLYGLSHEDFAYILDTFPVLKRKEDQAFGEYMSKRKCLEEYDRLGKVFASGVI